MAKPTTTGKTETRELALKLTDEQRKELIKFIAATGSANLDLSVQFDADVNRVTLAPVTVLVGNAI
jgi:hypothetical protein